MSGVERAKEWLASYRTHDAAWYLRELFQEKVIRDYTVAFGVRYCQSCGRTGQQIEHKEDCLISGAWRAAYIDKPLPHGDTIEGEE